MSPFLLEVLLGVDLLRVVRQECSRVFDISIFGGNSLILSKMRGQSVCHFSLLSANVSLFFPFLAKNS